MRQTGSYAELFFNGHVFCIRMCRLRDCLSASECLNARRSGESRNICTNVIRQWWHCALGSAMGTMYVETETESFIDSVLVYNTHYSIQYTTVKKLSTNPPEKNIRPSIVIIPKS